MPNKIQRDVQAAKAAKGTPTKATALDKVHKALIDEGFKSVTVKSPVTAFIGAKKYTDAQEVIAQGDYDGRPTVVRVWFSRTGAFLRYHLETRGVDWSGYPNTLKALLEDAGYGTSHIQDLSPVRNAERQGRHQRERQERQAQEHSEAVAKCRDARAAVNASRLAFIEALRGAISAQSDRLHPFDAAEAITDALLDSGVLTDLAARLGYLRAAEERANRTYPEVGVNLDSSKVN